MGKRHTEEDKKLLVSLYENGKSAKRFVKNIKSQEAFYTIDKALYGKEGTQNRYNYFRPPNCLSRRGEPKTARRKWNSKESKLWPQCISFRKDSGGTGIIWAVFTSSLCDALGLARGTFYNHMKSKKIQKLVDRQNEKFRSIIRKIFEDSKGDWALDQSVPKCMKWDMKLVSEELTISWKKWSFLQLFPTWCGLYAPTLKILSQ